jgi:hypothetical protein
MAKDGNIGIKDYYLYIARAEQKKNQNSDKQYPSNILVEMLSKLRDKRKNEWKMPSCGRKIP